MNQKARPKMEVTKMEVAMALLKKVTLPKTATRAMLMV